MDWDSVMRGGQTAASKEVKGALPVACAAAYTSKLSAGIPSAEPIVQSPPIAPFV